VPKKIPRLRGARKEGRTRECGVEERDKHKKTMLSQKKKKREGR